jgi:alkylhydroperoxidase/carboxymuconolactone decarboxylase family protein YurZ
MPFSFASIYSNLPAVVNCSLTKEGAMKIRKKILDYEYEEVLDAKTRELIRVGCAVAVGCPT